MTEFSVHTELLKRGGADPLSDWSHAIALLFGGVLAAVLIGAAFGTPPSEAMGEPAAAELSSVSAIIGPPAPQSVRVVAAAPEAVTRPSFAFGFLEFDWDPNAPGGVPGFDSSPKRDLRVAAVSPRN